MPSGRDLQQPAEVRAGLRGAARSGCDPGGRRLHPHVLPGDGQAGRLRQVQRTRRHLRPLAERPGPESSSTSSA
jgi:hypothetical protein